VTPAGVLGPDQFGVEISAPSVTVSGNQIDANGNGVEAVPASAGQSVANLSITGTTSHQRDGTALAQTTSTQGEASCCMPTARRLLRASTISNNVVAGSNRQMLLGGSGLTGLSVTGNDIGVGTGGVPLVSAGLGL